VSRSRIGVIFVSRARIGVIFVSRARIGVMSLHALTFTASQDPAQIRLLAIASPALYH